MKKIGNIIYDYNNDLVNHEKVGYIDYYQGTPPMDEIKLPLPTLYVGWDFFKTCMVKTNDVRDISILEKRIIVNKLYWEFSFKENKKQHVEGVEEFIKNAPYYYFRSNYKYTNLDPVMFSISGMSELMELLPKTLNIYYNYKNEMIYLLSENNIIGIDLTMYGYFMFDVDQIKTDLIERSSKVVADLDGEEYQKYYKIFPEFDDLKRYLTVLLIN